MFDLHIHTVWSDGQNTPEEMASPPADRPVKVGTEVHTTATALTLWINEFVEERYLAAFAKTADERGVCHIELLDTIDLARNFVCDKIREKWQREWDKTHGSESEVAK